jgi:hypothetical protein
MPHPIRWIQNRMYRALTRGGRRGYVGSIPATAFTVVVVLSWSHHLPAPEWVRLTVAIVGGILSPVLLAYALWFVMGTIILSANGMQMTDYELRRCEELGIS